MPATTSPGPAWVTLRTSGRPVSRSSANGSDGRNRSRCSASTGRTMPAGRVDRDDLARVDHGEPVGEPLGLFHEVGHQEDGHAPVADALDQVPRVPAGLRVQSGGQLVEDRDPRVPDERERDRQPLLLAAGELAERRVSRWSPRPRSSISACQSAGSRRTTRRGRALPGRAAGRAAGSPGAGRRPAGAARRVVAPWVEPQHRDRGRRRALRRPAMDSTVVVLPAPLGPRMPKISPSSTSKETPSTAARPP